MSLRRWIIKRLISPFWVLARGTTLGVRAIVIDPDDRVLLVRHTYLPGWYLPGGGVDVGEPMVVAVRRELLEEANVVIDGEPELIGFYHNPKTSKRDHVGLYLCRNWHQEAPSGPNVEIAETGFFTMDDLPDETTSGTRARLAEALAGGEKSLVWS